MSKKQPEQATQMDDELVEFTDRVLSGQSIEESNVDEELRALEATVVQLKALASDKPSEASMQRIEKQLINEWNKAHHTVEKQAPEWKKFLPGSRSQTGPRWPVLAFSFAVVAIILIALLPINQIVPSSIVGTAGNNGPYQIILFVAAAILVIGLLWSGRKKP